MRRLIQLDFVAPRTRLSWAGAGLLATGALALLGVTFEYRHLVEHKAGLEVRLAHLVERNTPRQVMEAPGDVRLAAGAAHAAEELSTPWTLLLSELEQAGDATKGDVALLGVEPDHAKHTVRVSAEARTLALAIAYVQRLQSSRSLEYPMLDRHEIRADDAQHPVRFEMTGVWRDSL